MFGRRIEGGGGLVVEDGEIGVGRNDGIRAGEYAAILYNKERIEPLESGTFWLSDTPGVPGSTSWSNTITRICTWARFSDLQTGKTFFLFNLHLDHRSQQSRERRPLQSWPSSFKYIRTR